MRLRINESYTDENQILNEKYWVEVQSNAPTAKPFYFYTTDKNVRHDIYTLLPVIKGTQTGTYKQTLNVDIVNELKRDYSIMGKGFRFRYSLTPVNIDSIPQNRKITLGDRDLRKTANDNIKDKFNFSSNIVIHHKDGDESNDDPDNLIVFERKSALDKAMADVAHIVAQNTNNFKDKNIAYTIQALEYDSNKDKFVPTHRILMQVLKTKI